MTDASNTLRGMIRHPTESNAVAALDLRPLGKHAVELLLRDPLTYAVATLMAVLVSVLSLGILVPPMAVGLITIIDRQRRGEPIHASMVWEGFASWRTSVTTGLVVAVGIAIGSLVLVIPGMFLVVLWTFGLHGVALQQLSGWAALRASWSVVWEHAGTVLLVLLACIGLNLLGSAFVIGWLLTAPLSLILLTLTHSALQPAA